MDDRIKLALTRDRVIDITTIGRKSGLLRRKEIWFQRYLGRYFITGLPGKRDWYANLCADPSFTFHLKESVQADLPARARIIHLEPERRELLAGLVQNLNVDNDLEEWIANSPLVEVLFVDQTANPA